MKLVDRRMCARKNHDEIHVVLDNSSTHKTKEVNHSLAKPFVWIKSADSVLASVARARAAVTSQSERRILPRTNQTRH